MNLYEKTFESITGIKFRVFYNTQKPKLVWYLSKWTKDLSIAEDFAQDAFVKALNSIDTFDCDRSQVHTWLYQIATNMVIKDYQDRQKLPLISMDKDFGGTNLSHFIPYQDTKKEQEKYKELCKKAEIIKNAILSLPEKQEKYKTVLILREIENLSYDEISDELNINLSTIKSQIRKGREIIIKKIDKKLKKIDNYGIE